MCKLSSKVDYGFAVTEGRLRGIGRVSLIAVEAVKVDVCVHELQSGGR